VNVSVVKSSPRPPKSPRELLDDVDDVELLLRDDSEDVDLLLDELDDSELDELDDTLRLKLLLLDELCE